MHVRIHSPAGTDVLLAAALRVREGDVANVTAEDVEIIWTNPTVQQRFSDAINDPNSDGRHDCLAHLCKEKSFQRVWAPGKEYSPSHMDVLSVCTHVYNEGVREIDFNIQMNKIKMVLPQQHKAEKRKWIEKFDDFLLCMFICDISAFDEVTHTRTHATRKRLKHTCAHTIHSHTCTHRY